MDPSIAVAVVGFGAAILSAVLIAVLTLPRSYLPPPPGGAAGPVGQVNKPVPATPGGRPLGRVAALAISVGAIGGGTILMVIMVGKLTRPGANEETAINGAALASGLLVVGVIMFGLAMRRQ